MKKMMWVSMFAVVSFSAIGCGTEDGSPETPSDRLLKAVRDANDTVGKMKANDEIITMRVALDVMAPVQAGINAMTKWMQVRLESGATDAVLGVENSTIAIAADEMKPTLASLGLPGVPAGFEDIEGDTDIACPVDSPTEPPTDSPTEPPTDSPVPPTDSPTEPTDSPTDSPTGSPDPTMQGSYAAKAACYATALALWRRATARCACWVVPQLITRCAIRAGVTYATAAGLCEAIQNE